MEAQAVAALGADDYSALLSMLTSSDASTRTQGQTLAKKLTPDEHQAFFDFQQQANKGKGEVTRQDNSVGGLPPEAAAIGAVGVGRAVAAEGLTLGQRGVAGLKSALDQAAPGVKYEATKSGLEHLGVPTPLAVAAAIAVSGYRKGVAKAAPAAEAPAAAAATPYESAPMSPLTGQTGTSMQPGPILRSPAPYETAIADAKAATAAPAAAAVPASAVATAPSPAGKPVLTADETKLASQWAKAKVPDAEIAKRIQRIRDLRASGPFANLPSSATVRRSVVDRNASGRWDEQP